MEKLVEAILRKEQKKSSGKKAHRHTEHEERKDLVRFERLPPREVPLLRAGREAVLPLIR